MRITELALLFAAVSRALAKHGAGEDDTPSSATPTQTSSSSSSPSPSPSPSPTAPPPFQFLPPANATTCQTTTLQWQWHSSGDISSDAVPLTLTVTNERATAAGTPSGAGTPLVSRTLATNVSAAAGQFAWRAVDVPAGAYVAVAFDTARTVGLFAQSPRFFVQAGEDSSCLAAASPSASGSASSPGDATPTSRSDGESASGGPADGAQERSQSQSLSPGVLGGVVAGVVVGVLLLILAATFPHYWKEALVWRRRNRHPGGPYHLF